MSSGENYGAHPHDRLISSIIFESFGISQGDEDTHKQAFSVYAFLQPELSQELLASLNDRWHGYDVQRKLAGSLVSFINREEHPSTPFKAGAYNMGDTHKAIGFMRELLMKRANRPSSAQMGQLQGVILGYHMLTRDHRYLAQPDGRGKPEPTEYSVLTANHNSHWLHYAFLTDPDKLPEYSIRHAAVFAARSLNRAIEARDAPTLLAAGVSQQALSTHMPFVLNTHLQHYPEHAAAIPVDMLLDRAQDAQFIQGLVPD